MTLEIILEKPIAYFPYLFCHHITFPQPRKSVERHGDDWWRPGNLVCNGPYRLTDFDPHGMVCYERNPGYFGTPSGNITRVEWHIVPDDDDRERSFRQGYLDYTYLMARNLADDLTALEQRFPNELTTIYLVIAPVYPLDDLKVRQALVHALDREAYSRPFQIKPANGGIVPPGMPGHSPGISLPYNLPLARRLLAEAGYPGGRGFPSVSGKIGTALRAAQELTRYWQDGLGLDINLEFHKSPQFEAAKDKIYSSGWVADYPDPDNFLRPSAIINFLLSHGWHDQHYLDLVHQAAETLDRSTRLEMYRKADHYMVNEQALLVPLSYGMPQRAQLIQPWVEKLDASAMGLLGARYFKINPENKPAPDGPDSL
jgi:ABC-type oligopeptide transport system substrate-binding subunit